MQLARLLDRRLASRHADGTGCGHISRHGLGAARINPSEAFRIIPANAAAAIDGVDGLLRDTVAQPDLDIVTAIESDT